MSSSVCLCASELRAKVARILKTQKPIKSNISKEEGAAIQDLRKDKSIKILPADNGKCTVILNTDDYLSKCQALLDDTKTYEKLRRDPTPKYKAELASILKSLLDNKHIDEKTWRRIYLTTDSPPKILRPPQDPQGPHADASHS